MTFLINILNINLMVTDKWTTLDPIINGQPLTQSQILRIKNNFLFKGGRVLTQHCESYSIFFLLSHCIFRIIDYYYYKN